ncbi:hypothetical protein H4R35_005232 [Dimargaris xerosporica]|nr:hypothetical protein H4R35_005232 [Dimargaris xerosporica]
MSSAVLAGLVDRLQRLGCPYAPLVQPRALEGDELGTALVQVLEWLADRIEPGPTNPLLVRPPNAAHPDSMTWSQRLHKALSALRFFGLCTQVECKLLTHPAPAASRLDLINRCVLFAEHLLLSSSPTKLGSIIAPPASLSPPSPCQDTACDRVTGSSSLIPSVSTELVRRAPVEQTVAQNCQLIDHIVAGSDLADLFSSTVTLFPKTWAFIARDGQPTAFDQEFEPWLLNAHARLAEHEASMDSELGPAVRQLRTKVDALGQLIASVESIPDHLSILSSFIDSSGGEDEGEKSVQGDIGHQQLIAQKRRLEQLVTELQNSLGILVAAKA